MYKIFFLPKILKNTIFLIMLFFSLSRITEAEVIRTVNNVAIDDEILNALRRPIGLIPITIALYLLINNVN